MEKLNMTSHTHKTLHKPEANQGIDLREIAEKLEIDFGQAIFDKLTYTENTHKKPTRLFDTTEHTSEVYYLDKEGKAFIKDYNSGDAYYSLTAYQRATGKDWQTSVIELGKEFGLIPMEYDSTPKPKWEYKPEKIITEKERNKGTYALTNPILKDLEGACLHYWTSLGVSLEMLKKEKIQTLEGFDLLNLDKGEVRHLEAEYLAFACERGKGVWKAYQPLSDKYKWSWIYADPTKPKSSTISLPYWYDEIIFTPDKKDKVFIVEGLKDCLILNAHFNQYGIHAIGLDSAGQTLAPEHIESLQKCCNELILCLDNDKTGIAQNQKKSLELGLPYLPYTFGKGKDIADLIQAYEPDKILAWLQNGKRESSIQPSPTQQQNISVGTLTEEEPQLTSTNIGRKGEGKQKNIPFPIDALPSVYKSLCTQAFERKLIPIEFTACSKVSPTFSTKT